MKGLIPYYLTEEMGFLPYPWHYVFFSQFKTYRSFIGGTWRYVRCDDSYSCWMRMKPGKINMNHILEKTLKELEVINN